MKDSHTPNLDGIVDTALHVCEQAATADDAKPTHGASQVHPEDGPRGDRAKQGGSSPPLDSTVKVELLRPILDRVRRSDHWFVANGSAPSHRTTVANQGQLRDHVSSLYALGFCPMERGSSTTTIAILDLDSHKGEVSWARMREIAREVIVAAGLMDVSLIPFRSRGGQGMHLIAIWTDPQDARSVRHHLAAVLSACGLKNGTRGVAHGEVEIFPKQDQVPADGWGNMFVLPMSGESEALSPVDLAGIFLTDVMWPVSDPVPVAPPEPARLALTVIPHGTPEFERVKSALFSIEPDSLDYHGWLHLVFATHHGTEGSEEGRALVHAWSAQYTLGHGYSEAETDTQWNFCKGDKAGGITVGTLLKQARDAGWVDPAFAPSADGFEDVTLDGERERLRLFKIFANDTQTDEDCSSLLRMPGEVQVEILNLLDMALTDEQMTAVREVVSKARGAQGQDLPHAALLREIDSYPDDCDAARRRALVAKVTTVLAHSPVNETEESFVLQALKAKAGVGLTAARKEIAKLRAQVRAETGGLSVKNPTGNAAALVADRFAHDGVPTLRRWQGEFFVWNGARYEPIGDEDARTQVYAFFADARLQVESRASVDNTVDALRAEVNVPSNLSMPAWLGGQPPVDDLQEVIPVGNGLLHVPTRALHPHDPRFFSGHALAVNFDPDAPQPVAWLDFLASIFPGDPDSAALLQEWMGYLLTHDTSKQKALMMVGRTRSGKGTIARLIAKLIGAHDVCGPSLASLGTQFGLQQMIGKGLAIISDARMSKMADSGAITESLLRITGEDQVSVPRKHLIDWNGQLPTRFMLVANTLPAIVDAGGALAGRFVVLHFEVSFLGREDAGLDEKLRAELPGILNWALEGRERLHARGPTGQFTQPASGEAAIHELRRATTPMLAFIEDAIEFDPAAHVSRDDLFAAYGRWISEQHVDGARGTRFSLSKSAFGREFNEQVGERVRDRQLGAQGNRQWVYWGVRLRGSLVAPASDELF